MKEATPPKKTRSLATSIVSSYHHWAHTVTAGNPVENPMHARNLLHRGSQLPAHGMHSSGIQQALHRGVQHLEVSAHRSSMTLSPDLEMFVMLHTSNGNPMK